MFTSRFQAKNRINILQSNGINEAGFPQDTVLPRMSSHCHKKYAAFLPRKWLKTACFCIEDVI